MQPCAESDHQATAEGQSAGHLPSERGCLNGGIGEKRVALVVDDDPAIARLLSVWLQAEGLDVFQAFDGDEALLLVQQHAPHYVLLDWHLPGLSGPQICERIRGLELPHYTHVVIFTGHADGTETNVAFDAGADDFLRKPIHKSDFLARMRSGTRVLDLEQRLVDLAQTDVLTGIPSKRRLQSALSGELDRISRYGGTFSCVMVDVDYFKRINDNYGHPVGDVVLKAVAKALKDSCRTTDLVGRFGGEEFCIILPETIEANATLWADRVRKKLEAMQICALGKSLRITASFGVAGYLEDVASPEQLLDMADQALLMAKRAGRNRVISYAAVNAASVDVPGDAGFSDPFEGLQAWQVMAPTVVCLSPEDTCKQAAEFFLHCRVNSLPIVDEQGHLAGIVSEHDLMSSMFSPNAWNHPVREVMKSNVISFDDTTPVRTIYDFLCRVTIRRVVIVRDNHPVGIIGRSGLLRWFSNWVMSQNANASTPSGGRGSAAEINRRALTQTVESVVDQAHLLSRIVEANEEDLSTSLVALSSGMQDLLCDLLTHCQRSGESAHRTAAQLADGDPLMS